jgi:hypothetical protein
VLAKSRDTNKPTPQTMTTILSVSTSTSIRDMREKALAIAAIFRFQFRPQGEAAGCGSSSACDLRMCTRSQLALPTPLIPGFARAGFTSAPLSPRYRATAERTEQNPNARRSEASTSQASDTQKAVPIRRNCLPARKSPNESHAALTTSRSGRHPRRERRRGQRRSAS